MHNTGKEERKTLDLDSISKTSTTSSKPEIFSILSSTRAWTSVILEGKRDGCRHFTKSFCKNVVLADTSYKVLLYVL